MLLSTIGKSRTLSVAFVRTLAKVAPMLGMEVKPDTVKRRLKNPDGTWRVGSNGRGVYEELYPMNDRFFLGRAAGNQSRFDFLNRLYILTARKQVKREAENITGRSYHNYHRGLLTIAKERKDGDVIWDIQNRDVV